MEKNKIRVLLVSPYNAIKVGGIGTWSKSVLDFFEGSDEYEIIFQNTANLIKGNIKNSRIRRVILGVEDTVEIIVKLFFHLLLKRPDVVHYTSSASLALMKDRVAIFIVKVIFKKRFVIHWHFGRIPEICISKGKEYKQLIHVAKYADINIVLDEKSQQSLQREAHANVCYIPNPMTSAVYDATKDIDIASSNKKRNNGEVLFVGHIIENKGVFELVKCCVDCKDVKKLVLIGPVLPSIKEKILSLAKKRTDGTWLEFKGELQREDVYSYYRKCTLFCLPSYTEGFPYVILEAMAFGCPILATDVGAIAEMLNNESGLVVAPRDIQQLSVALNKMLSDKELRDKIATNAFNRVMTAYTREIICKQYSKIWSNMR